MIIPDSALPYIRLQRGDCRVEDLRADFTNRMLAEYVSMVPFLPVRCARLLDVGCGICGIDVHLWKCYPAVKLCLFDRDETGKAGGRYGFHEGNRFYSSWVAARELLEANGVPRGSTRFLDAPGWLPSAPARYFDLIISLASWGFHYPISTYLADVVRTARPGATVIVDVRRGTPGVSDLSAVLDDVREIPGIEKAHRIVGKVRAEVGEE